uniref:Protein transport protein Sec61 subunit beta n=1 Tax=Phytophthora ramorum TaxID=164328 RepID=H3GH51_PHYRM
MLRRAMRAALVVICTLVGIAASVSVPATTCSITAASVSNYAASTSTAAAVVEKEDCSVDVVRVATDSDGTTQLDLSSREIVYVKSLPSVMKLIANLGNASIPSAVQTLFYASNGELASLRNVSFPSTVSTLNFSNNPITYVGGVVFPSSLKVLSITSTGKLAEFEVRQTDATLFASLQTFNVSKTTSLTCSDGDAVYRYVQDTLLCVLADDAFNSKYGVGETSASGSADVAAITIAPELAEASSSRRSKFLLFAAVSLSLAFAGLMGMLAPRTLYERYQKKKYLNLRKKRQLQQLQAVGTNGALTGKKPAPTASAEGAAASGLRNRRPVAAARSGQNTGRGMGGSSAGILRFYTDDSPGLKIGPTTVLVSCLLFVGFVVLLHVWGKFRG